MVEAAAVISSREGAGMIVGGQQIATGGRRSQNSNSGPMGAKHVSIARMSGQMHSGMRARGAENIQPNNGAAGANYELNSGSMFQMGPAGADG